MLVPIKWNSFLPVRTHTLYYYRLIATEITITWSQYKGLGQIVHFSYIWRDVVCLSDEHVSMLLSSDMKIHK